MGIRNSVANRRGLILDWAFLLGVLLKALDGLSELVLGVPALFVTHLQVMQLARAVTADELAEDPHDLIANLILDASARTSHSALFVAGLYLVIHGVVKLSIVIALFAGSTRVYPWAVSALIVLAIVQVVDLVITFSIGVLVLTVLDLAVIALTVREWRHSRTLREVIRQRVPLLR